MPRWPGPHTEAPLVRTAELGPFFAVDLRMDGSGWLPLAELSRPEVLRDRVEAAREVIAERSGLALDEVEERATASIVFLGWAARLISPAVGCAVLSAQVPGMADVFWQAGVGSPMPLALPSADLAGAVSASDLISACDLAQLVYQRAVIDAIEPLLDAVSKTFSLSSTVLWGDVASSVAGSAKLIAATRPELAPVTEELTDELLSQGPLQGKGAFTRETPSRRAFRRTTCCLFYRIPGAGYCGDCVLTPTG
ncbi:MAG: hypothetical protein JWM76_1665 [Pseudonocardiales bacterium]|nr:hypothetical protein [Pseudonocardiales bacterium]